MNREARIAELDAMRADCRVLAVEIARLAKRHRYAPITIARHALVALKGMK